MSSTEDDVLLELRSLSKTFAGQVALDQFDLTLRRGEIYGLVGHNGSGKSTLVKLLAGYHEPDPGGEIAYGSSATANTDRAARPMHFIHQDLGLVETLNTVDNLALGAGYCRSRLRRIQWRRQRQLTREALEGFTGTPFDIDVPVRELTLGQRAAVAIARAFRSQDEHAPVFVLDEPTAALHPDEAEQLFAAVRHVARSGGAALFVSHRLKEVLGVADRIGVLRQGVLVDERHVREWNEQSLIDAIVGSATNAQLPAPPTARGEIVLTVSGVSGQRLRELDMDVRAGEIVGVTGLEGSGKEEVAELLVGGRRPVSGRVSVSGHAVATGSPRAALQSGMALVLGDRSRALVRLHPVRENATLLRLPTRCPIGWIRRADERREVTGLLERFDVQPCSPERLIEELSGGNQQKVVMARWLRTEPSILILDEPTIGVDIGAKVLIHEHIRDAAAAGAAVVLCSSEARDLAQVADRVLVLRDGSTATWLHGERLTEAQITRETLGGAVSTQERSPS